MDKALLDKLRETQENPTTGTAHNKQLISTQVEAVIAMHQLNDKLGTLIETIESNEKQNNKLEISNISLQRAMLFLTAITTIIAVFPFIKEFFIYLTKFISISLNTQQLPLFLVEIISAIIAVIVAFVAYKYERKTLDETITLKDSIHIVLRDKLGKIKEERHSS